MNHNVDITNVLIVGCGGAGLRAAIEAKISGLSVKVLGKRSKDDAHTVLAAGGINAAFGNLDKNDSWEYHFADTFNEGYSVANPKMIEVLTKEAPSSVKEIDEWGANFKKLPNGTLDQRFFGAHSFRRTCYSGDYTGQSILKALLKKIKDLSIPIFDSEYVSDLLIEDNLCFGAMSFNTKSGERTVHLADSIILCTGGHTRLWKKSSSRAKENTGDGFFLGLKAGCQLIDMEMVQFHPTGMIFPEEIAGTLVTEAVRGEGGKLLNGLGERFMKKYDIERMELSTRDKVAIANYSEIISGRTSPNGGVFLDISHKSKDFILSKIPRIYRQFIEYQMLDISKEPMEVAPTSHYSMGGIDVDPIDHSTKIKGLYAAGEVAGGLHGANRLGGNSLAEILVFGKKAGAAAAKNSKSLNSHQRSNRMIKLAHQNLDNFIKSGNELSIPLQNELREIMWNYCGVVKDKEKLQLGLNNLKKIKEKFSDIDVRVTDGNYDDLVNICDLEASIISSEATIKSALMREESRGAHQRSDFPEMNKSINFNCFVKLKNKLLKVEKRNKSPISKNYLDILSVLDNQHSNDDIGAKLLE